MLEPREVLYYVSNCTWGWQAEDPHGRVTYLILSCHFLGFLPKEATETGTTVSFVLYIIF